MKQHDRERAKIGLQFRERISAQVDQIRADHSGALVQARHRFMRECADLRKRQDEAREALRQQWSQHNAERRTAFQEARTAVQSVERNGGKSLGRYEASNPPNATSPL